MCAWPARFTVFADRLCVYHAQNLVASHPRSYERNRDFENPDHVKELLDQRRLARDAKWLLAFYALSPQAEYYYQQLQTRSLNARQHVNKIVALAEIYGGGKVAAALEDALASQAFSSQYIENILQQRARHNPAPGPLHLTRRADLLDLELAPADLSPYDKRQKTMTTDLLENHLDQLRLPFIKKHCQDQATKAAKTGQSHLDYLATLIAGEAAQRFDRATARRIRAARFPVIKTLDSFRWDWPQKINRLQIQDLFRLQFIQDKANVIFLGLVGSGKSHLACALGYAACERGHSVLFTNTIDVINTLCAAQLKGNLKAELHRYNRPELLILDEVGYLPIDQRGADLLFQVISARYERGSIILTTNKAFKNWPS